MSVSAHQMAAPKGSSIGSWLVVSLVMVLGVAMLVMVLAGAASGRTVILEDDFDGPDGSDPDASNWTVFTADGGDDVWIEDNSLVTNVSNSGSAAVIVKRTLETNSFTVLCDFKVEDLEGKPLWVQVRSLDGTVYREWFTFEYDSVDGWSYHHRKDGSLNDHVSYSRTLSPNTWFSLNVSCDDGKFEVKVREKSSGNIRFSKSMISVDALRSDNTVSLGVTGDQYEGPMTYYDDFRLWDERVPPDEPPLWGFVPPMQATEDVPFDFDFTDHVSDPDDPVTSLSISSDSDYVSETDGLTVTFLFPNNVTSASVPLRLTDGNGHSDTTVEFTVTPVNDAPEHAIPHQTVAEEDVELALNLSDLIWDEDDAKGDLVLTTDSAYATVDGQNVTLLFPEGVLEHTLYLNISDGELSTEAVVDVTVIPVNDLPRVEGLSEFTALEDSLSTLNLSGFIVDPDTPLEEITVRSRSGPVYVDDLEVRFAYHTGGQDHIVMLEITDGFGWVSHNLVVHVTEVNDPPFVSEISQVIEVTEDEPYTIDLLPFIDDEDDHPGHLSIECDEDVMVSIDRFNLTVLFTTGGWEHRVHFRASDGEASTNGSFWVEVWGVNDPPVVTGLGGLSAPYTVTLGELEDQWLQVHVEDEENTVFSYRINSDWNKVIVFQNGTVRVSADPGDVGVYYASVLVDDLFGGTTELPFTIEVYNVNDPPDPPTLIHPLNHTSVEVGTSVTFRALVYDPDLEHGQTVTVTWASNVSGAFKTMSGGRDLSFDFNELPVGVHRIEVTVSDGNLSRTAWSELTVTEAYVPPEPQEEEGFLGSMEGMVLVVALVLVVVLTVAAGFMMGKRSARPAPPPPAAAPVERTEEEAAADMASLGRELDDLATSLEAHRAVEVATTATAAAGEWEVEEGTEEEAAPEPTEEDLAERAHTQEVRDVMRVLTQLPRGLPTALWGRDLSELSRDIVDAERRTSPDGKPLVLLDGTWYVAAVENVGTFLSEWKETREDEEGPSDEERRRKLEKLEESLLEGRISEETYERLRKKYEG